MPTTSRPAWTSHGKIIGISLAFLGAAAPALAQHSATNAQEIVVTAPSATDTILLRDNPANARVLLGDTLTRQGHTNLADMLNANLGSVSISNGTGSPYQSDVAYRGFQATSLLGSPTGLSVYLDGVRMNEPFGGGVNWDLIPMNAIARVDVLPGSNPLFGLNTLGGALVLSTRNGADDGGLAVKVEGGSFSRRAFQAEAGGTLANTALDWFVAGNIDKQDGYRWYTNSDVKQVYGKLRWHGAATTAELSAIWADTALSGTQGLPLSMLATPQMAYTWPDTVANTQIIGNLKLAAQLDAGLKLSGNVYYRRASSRSVNSNAGDDDGCADGSRDCTASAPNGTAADLNVTNPFPADSAKYAHFIPYAGALPIEDYTGNINTTLVFSTTRQDIFGGNALLDSDRPLFGLTNDFNLGGSFETARITYDQTTDLAYLVNYQTVPMPWNFKYGSTSAFQASPFQGSPLVASVRVASRNTSYNLFVRDMVKPTGSLSLTGSLGFTATHITLSGANATYLNTDGGFSWTGSDGAKYYNPAYIGASYWTTSNAANSRLATAILPPGAVAGPEISPINGAHTYHRLNPAIGLAWNPRKQLGLFASYSEAMRAPTAIELSCADPATPCALPTGFNGDPYLPAVVARTIELGMRGSVAGGSAVRRASWNAALYRTRLDNDIQFIYDPSGLGYFANVGSTERKGFELGVDVDLARLQLAASYGYVSATYRSPFTDASGDLVTPGNHIAGIPAQAFKLRAIYRVTKALTLGANLMTASSQYAHGDEANVHGAVPGYTLVNLDAHVRPLAGLELFVRIANLFDRQYATYGQMGTNIYTASDEQFRTPAQGRGFTLGLRYSPGAKGVDDDD